MVNDFFNVEEGVCYKYKYMNIFGGLEDKVVEFIE